MKRRLMFFGGFLLMLTLASCGSNGDNRRLSDTVSAVSVEQVLSSSAGSVEPAEGDSTESGEQVSPALMEDRGSTAAAFAEKDVAGRQIRITTEEGGEIVFELNESPAAGSFYRQLPLSVWVEDYAGSEKIFYPPETLDTNSAPLAQGPAGTLAYYAPWGNVAVFYGECGGNSSLYELGEAVAGVELISAMTGEVQIAAVGALPASSASGEAESASSPQSSLVSSAETRGLQEPTVQMRSEENTAMKMNLQIGNSTFTATLEKNAAADSFAALMKTAPVVLQMSDYAGFEKVGSLGTSLPASNSQITTQSGEIVLYNGNQIVIFYGSNSWSYTRLGKIDDLTGWEEALGDGDVTVAFSLT